MPIIFPLHDVPRGRPTPLIPGIKSSTLDVVIGSPPPPRPLLLKVRKLSRLSFPRLLPLPAPRLFIYGVTKDGSGAVLGGCTATLFRTSDDLMMEKIVSDATTGVYSFSSVGMGETYYAVFYKAGSPDVAGTTVNTLVGTGV